MFVGREHELSVLEETYNQSGFRMTVIYGRRRIGKSTLITEFIKDKKASYYIAAKSSLEDNVKKMECAVCFRYRTGNGRGGFYRLRGVL